MADIQDAVAEAKASRSSLQLFTQRRHLPQLLFAILIPVFQQFTGINAFMFYGALTTFSIILSMTRCI